jgi:hypothetical protein
MTDAYAPASARARHRQPARLYHTPLSPFSRKVRLVLAEKRIEVELAEERYWEQGPELFRRNPAGKIPVLRLDGMLLAESQAICEYLDETIPTPPLMPDTAAGRYEVRRLCAWFDDKFNAEVTRPVLTDWPHAQPRRFRGGGAFFLPRLHLGRGLGPLGSGAAMVCDDQIAPGLPQRAGRSGAGAASGTALRAAGLLNRGSTPDPEVFQH